MWLVILNAVAPGGGFHGSDGDLDVVVIRPPRGDLLEQKTGVEHHPPPAGRAVPRAEPLEFIGNGSDNWQKTDAHDEQSDLTQPP
ncbi:MAG: hypothetical protein JRE82_18175, partial [Deltaproteobacteria bacterium]|nr:hypothetical protein [Deltaproteobacteria bacterium]